MNAIEEFEIYRSSKENPQHLLKDKLSFECIYCGVYNTAIDIIGGSERGRKG
jgi:hypothetical protein